MLDYSIRGWPPVIRTESYFGKDVFVYVVFSDADGYETRYRVSSIGEPEVLYRAKKLRRD